MQQPLSHEMILFSRLSLRTIRFCLLVFCLFNSIPRLAAQKITATVTDTYKMEIDELVTTYKWGNEYITFEETGKKMQFGYTFKLSKVKFGIRLLRYDSNMKVIKEHKVAGGDRNFGPFPGVLRKIVDKLYLFYFTYDDEENNVMKVLAAELNPTSLELGTPIPILNMKLANTGLMKSYELLSKSNLTIKWSPDGTKMLALWASGMDNVTYLSVHNLDMKKIWEKTETSNLFEKGEVEAVTVDNNGNAFVAYKYKPRKEDPVHSISMYKEKGAAKTMDVTLPEGRAYQVMLTTNADGSKIIATGTWMVNDFNLTGVFSQAISTANFKAEKLQPIPFTEAFVKEMDNDSWGNTKDKKFGITPLSMEAHLLSDGSIAMAGQFEEVRPGQRINYLVSGAIVNVRIRDGKAVVGYMPKHRVSSGITIGHSFYAFPYNDKLIIFYNDVPRNLDKKIGEKYANSNIYRDVSLVAASMDNNGVVKRENVIDLTKENFLPVGEAMRPQSSSSLLVPVPHINGLGRVTNEAKWAMVHLD